MERRASDGLRVSRGYTLFGDRHLWYVEDQRGWNRRILLFLTPIQVSIEEA